MRYLIDTDVLSNLEKERPCPRLIDWFRRVPAEDVFIPINAIFEIQKGIELARESHPERARQREEWLECLLAHPSGGFVSLDPMAARLYARMVCTPELRRFFLQPAEKSKKIKTGDDLAIAAIAIRMGAAIVSFNERDFLLIHGHFPLPGLFHPGRLEWCVHPEGGPLP